MGFLGLFGGKKKGRAPRPAPVTVGRHKVVQYTGDGRLEYHARNAAEAKLAIQELRLKMKEIALQKREIASELKNIRAGRQIKLARRGSLPRGGGKLGKVARALDHMGRNAERSAFADEIAPLELRRAVLDQMLIKRGPGGGRPPGGHRPQQPVVTVGPSADGR